MELIYILPERYRLCLYMADQIIAEKPNKLLHDKEEQILVRRGANLHVYLRKMKRIIENHDTHVMSLLALSKYMFFYLVYISIYTDIFIKIGMGLIKLHPLTSLGREIMIHQGVDPDTLCFQKPREYYFSYHKTDVNYLTFKEYEWEDFRVIKIIGYNQYLIV